MADEDRSDEGEEDIRDEPGDDEDFIDDAPEDPARDEELSIKEKVRSAVIEIADDVEQGFVNQNERSNKQMDYWDIYNCILTGKQFYSGNSKIFVPIVYNAVNARKTRFTNQIFPVSGRYVDVTSENGDQPSAITALLENYVQLAKLRTRIMPALMKNGDIEGQYNLYVTWRKKTRHVAQKIKKPIEIEGEELPGDDDIDDIEEQTIVQGSPSVEVLADSDVLVLPATADSIDEAIEDGGSVTVLRRWTKSRIRKAIADKEITKKGGNALISALKESDKGNSKKDKAQDMVDAAGIVNGRIPYANVYEIWTKLKIGKERRICRCYFGGTDNVLSVKRNPYWSDKLPVLSVPVEKVQGSFKSKSKVEPVADLQYFANDTTNEGADSSAYALMPIVMTDPEKNPRVGSMILSMAAIWETSPESTQFAKFPEMWKDALAMVATIKTEIFQTLSVNPAVITQQGTQYKLNSAQIAQEQQVDILTTADAVTVVEEGVLTPLLARFVELDHQYRDDKITVRQYGEMGMRANMEVIEPIQMNRRYQFKWFGVEAARSAQQMQQQIAALNVIRGIPPQQYEGYKLDLRPIITQICENVFGPRLAPLVFQSMAMQMSVPAIEENMLLDSGYEAPTHELDNDDEHIAVHTLAMQTGAQNKKKYQVHIFAHMQQKAKKLMMQQQQAQAAQGMLGVPGGAGPGVAGTPQQGAQPGQPRFQGPPGMIHQDQMQDPAAMPRNMA